MILTEEHRIYKSSPMWNECDTVCWKSKCVYNSALYAMRQNFIRKEPVPSGFDIINRFVKDNQPDYKSLPAKVAQRSVIGAYQAMKSFFALLKSSKVDSKNVKLPKYKKRGSEGRYKAEYTIQAISKKELKTGTVRLSGTDIKVKTRRPEAVKQCAVVPESDHYRIIVFYEVPEPEVNTEMKPKKYASVDLGLNNLMTVAGPDIKQVIYSGRPLKSINRYYNKKRSKIKSKLECRNKQKTSKKLRSLNRKRNDKVKDYIHKTTRSFIDHAVSAGITTVVVGYNTGWKQEINLGSRTNQNFVQIPYLQLLSQLKYKCRLAGLEFITTEEPYTSKCSFLDGEEPGYHERYSGTRVKRGLYRTKTGILINADVNGALNILRHAIGNYDYDPIQVCSTPQRVTPTR